MNKNNVNAIMSDPDLPKFDTKPIRDVLGDAMPKMPLSKTGRLRLVSALAYKYGENFRNFEQAHSALSHFDSEYNTMRTYLRLKGHIRG